jgi:hypothetical protein
MVPVDQLLETPHKPLVGADTLPPGPIQVSVHPDASAVVAAAASIAATTMLPTRAERIRVTTNPFVEISDATDRRC